MSMFESFRSGGIEVAGVFWRLVAMFMAIGLLLWLGAWLLSWHFMRAVGLMCIVLAGHVAYGRSTKK
jgi:hypothetical protein